MPPTPPSTIRAKVCVKEVLKTHYGQPAENVKMSAVYGNGEENKSYSNATPSASFEMNVSNPSALGFFQPGQEYYVDFVPATPPPTA